MVKNSLLKEVRRKQLEELKLNNSFYGLDLLQEKKTNDGDNENLTNSLTQNLSEVGSSISLALSVIQIISFRLSNLYSLLFNQGTLLVAALMYGLTIKPLQDFVAKGLVEGTKKEELKLYEQFTGKMNQLFFCSESIALRSGGVFEINSIKEICAKAFKNRNWQLCFEIYRSSLSSAQDVLTTFSAMYLLADQVVSKTINIDEFMMTRYQLSNVISSMNEDQYLMDSYIQLEQALKNLDHISQKIKAWNTLMKQRKLTIHHGNTVKFKGKIELPLECGNKFKTIVEVTNPVIFQKGKWYRIKGKSGSGKTTIFRAFSGLWPYVSGRLEIPQTAEFLPQKAFIPTLSAKLKDIIRFPEMKHLSSAKEKEIKEMMTFLGLEMELNEEQNWDRILSGGQKQKIALISALIKKPECLILDEPTAAMDKDDQVKVHSLIPKKLPNAIVIYTDHHPLESIGNQTVYEITKAKKLTLVK